MTHGAGMNPQITLFVIAAVAISGCAVQIAPTDSNQTVSNIVVKLPPERTYQNLVRATRERCFPATIDAEFFQNSQEGDVSISTNYDVSTQVVWATFRLRPIGQDTAVTMRSPGRIREFFEPATKWMNGAEAPCPIDRR